MGINETVVQFHKRKEIKMFLSGEKFFETSQLYKHRQKMKLPKQSGTPWLNDRTIFLTKTGSQAYGTSLPTSDLDIRGIAVAPKEFYHGFVKKFEQAIFKEPDAVVYELQKFMDLAAKANPSILEMLWTDPEDHLKVTSSAQKLLDNRDLFLSKKVRYTFLGYAMSQLKRIKTHKKWLLNPPKKQPKRSDFDLPKRKPLPREQMGALNSLIQRKLDSWQIDWEIFEINERRKFKEELQEILEEMQLGKGEQQFSAAARVIGIDENFVQLLMRERGYADAKKNWKNYQNWKLNRNKKRAALEAAFGYDAKHAMHLVRLCRMGTEILETGIVRVRRPDAEELLEIRSGAWPYEKLINWVEKQEDKFAELYKTSDLPNKPNRQKLDKLCCEIVGEMMEK